MRSSASKSRKTRKSPPTKRGHDAPTGAGSEAAAGIHGAGSEPLVGREVVHKSGYGGEGGRPRTSSDQREDASKQQPASGK